MNKIKTILAVVALMFCGGVWASSGEAATGKVISFNVCQLKNNGQAAAGGLTVGQSYATLVGDVPYAGWAQPAEPLSGGNYTESNLVQYDFATQETSSSGVSCAMYINNTTNISREPTKGATYEYLSAFLSMFAGSTYESKLTFSNIPYRKYDVYVYFSGCNGTLDSGKRVTNFKCLRLNNGSYYKATTEGGTVVTSGSNDTWGDNSVNNRIEEGVNVLIFRDQTSSTLTLGNNFNNHGMAAVQIVDRTYPKLGVMSFNICNSLDEGGGFVDTAAECYDTLAGFIPGGAWQNVGDTVDERDYREGSKTGVKVWSGTEVTTLNGVTIMWTCNGADMANLYSSVSASAHPFLKCFYGRRNETGLGYASFTIGRVPYENYDVIVYLSASGNGTKANQAITINGVRYYGEENAGVYNTARGTNSSWGTPTDTSSLTYGANAIRCVQQTSEMCEIKVESGSAKWGIAAIQIVEIQVASLEIPTVANTTVSATVYGEERTINDGILVAPIGSRVVVTYTPCGIYTGAPVSVEIASVTATSVVEAPEVPMEKILPGTTVVEDAATLQPMLQITGGPANTEITVTVGGNTFTETTSAAGAAQIPLWSESVKQQADKGYTYTVSASGEQLGEGAFFMGNVYAAAYGSGVKVNGSWTAEPDRDEEANEYMLNNATTGHAFAIADTTATAAKSVTIAESITFTSALEELPEVGTGVLADAKGALTLFDDNGTLRWKGLVSGTWVTLTGVDAETGAYVIKNETSTEGAKARYLVGAVGEESDTVSVTPLVGAGTDEDGWFSVTGKPTAVAFVGTGRLAKVEAMVGAAETDPTLVVEGYVGDAGGSKVALKVTDAFATGLGGDRAAVQAKLNETPDVQGALKIWQAYAFGATADQAKDGVVPVIRGEQTASDNTLRLVDGLKINHAAGVTVTRKVKMAATPEDLDDTSAAAPASSDDWGVTIPLPTAENEKVKYIKIEYTFE